MKTQFLKLIQPIVTDDLIRVGRNTDGGYVINKSAIDGVDLVSFGINDDWSFEEAFAKLSRGNVMMYDGSVSENKFRTDLANLLFEPFSLRFFYSAFRIKGSIRGYFGKTKNALRVYQDFKTFISKQEISFYDKFISNYDDEKILSIATLISELPKEKQYFFKVDIEGSEYRILNDLRRNAPLVSGMVIEFHDLDIMYNEFSGIISQLKQDFYITHVHPNNYNPVHPLLGVPGVWEITFLNKRFLKEAVQLASKNYPIDLDFKNTSAKPDFYFSYNE